MITILNNLSNSLVIQASLIFSDIIHLLVTPLGAGLMLLLLLFLEYIAIKSIINDPNEFIFKAFINYTKNYILKRDVYIKKIPDNT